MPDGVRVTPTADGPYMVGGEFALQWPSGHVISMAGEADENGYIYLCRCGHSNNKRFATTRTSVSASNQPKAMPPRMKVSPSAWESRPM